MPLFRFHRGSLEESLKTTVIINSLSELEDKITEAMRNCIFIKEDTLVELEIHPYPSIENNFDDRIGWYTHIVIAKYKNITAHPVGFLSEDIE
jgi:hypothetical protein